MKHESKEINRLTGNYYKSNAIKSLAFIVLLAAMSINLIACEKSFKLDFKTNYQAVLVSNNSVYFGRIEEMGPQFITLSDVFYIQSRPTDDPKLMNNVLVRRGKEIHKPDKMYINREHIVAIEPVANDSQLTELIRKERESERK